MVQIVQTIILHAGQQKIFSEKPHVLRRIFVSIQVLASFEAWAESRISFDGPKFYTFYVLDGPAKHFEIKGEGLPQEDIWVRNSSDIDIYYTATEILA